MAEANVSISAFATLHGVSRKTVYEWKTRGYLSFAGDLVDVETTNAHLAAVGKSRLNPVTLKRQTARRLRKLAREGDTLVAKGDTSCAQGNNSRGEGDNRDVTLDAHAFPWVAGASLMAASCSELVLALLDHLPMATVRPLVGGVVAEARADVVAIADGDEGPPPGFGSWAEHPWFTDPPLTEAEWAELEEEHSHGGGHP